MVNKSVVSESTGSQRSVVVIGASGHARVIADIIRCAGDEVVGFWDDRDKHLFPTQKTWPYR